MPKYMTLIAKDLKEDRDHQSELAFFNLQQRNLGSIDDSAENATNQSPLLRSNAVSP